MKKTTPKEADIRRFQKPSWSTTSLEAGLTHEVQQVATTLALPVLRLGRTKYSVVHGPRARTHCCRFLVGDLDRVTFTSGPSRALPVRFSIRLLGPLHLSPSLSLSLSFDDPSVRLSVYPRGLCDGEVGWDRVAVEGAVSLRSFNLGPSFY